jgi:RNA polymerase sigma factor (sigma-70 family)
LLGARQELRFAHAFYGIAVSKPARFWISPRGETSPSENLVLSNHEIFWRIWSSHHEYLFGLSLRWMRGNRADAEDALSAVKLKAVRHLEAPGPAILNERAWLSRLLYNVCMDLYRRRGRGEPPVPAELDRSLEDVRKEAPERSAEQRLLERELYRRIEGLLGELPPNWRHAFIERFLREESYGEIARKAGTTEANIRKRVQLARAFLRERLGDGTLSPAKRESQRHLS